MRADKNDGSKRKRPFRRTRKTSNWLCSRAERKICIKWKCMSNKILYHTGYPFVFIWHHLSKVALISLALRATILDGLKILNVRFEKVEGKLRSGEKVRIVPRNLQDRKGVRCDTRKNFLTVPVKRVDLLELDRTYTRDRLLTEHLHFVVHRGSSSKSYKKKRLICIQRPGRTERFDRVWKWNYWYRCSILDEVSFVSSSFGLANSEKRIPLFINHPSFQKTLTSSFFFWTRRSVRNRFEVRRYKYSVHNGFSSSSRVWPRFLEF